MLESSLNPKRFPRSKLIPTTEFRFRFVSGDWEPGLKQGNFLIAAPLRFDAPAS
jgi:hypothetical protein